MSAGFITEFEGRSKDGRNWVHTAPVDFLDEDGIIWRAPIGSTTDGPSWPNEVESLISRDQKDKAWMPADLHDSGYRQFLQRWNPLLNGFERANLKKEQVDDLFDCALRINGVSDTIRKILVDAVRYFGAKPFTDDALAAPIDMDELRRQHEAKKAVQSESEPPNVQGNGQA